MSWQNILFFVSSMIVSFGGAGAIIAATSKWFGGIIANKLMQKNQAKYDKELEQLKNENRKEIEHYKNELQIVCERVKKQNAESIYVTEKQFDIEIALIQELTEKAFALEMRAKELFPWMSTDKEYREKYQVEIYQNEAQARSDFINALGKAQAFIDEGIFNSYKEFEHECNLQEFYYDEKILGKVPWEDNERRDCIARTKKIYELNFNTNKQIKEYLKKLKIME